MTFAGRDVLASLDVDVSAIAALQFEEFGPLFVLEVVRYLLRKVSTNLIHLAAAELEPDPAQIGKSGCLSGTNHTGSAASVTRDMGTGMQGGAQSLPRYFQ